MNDGTLKKEAIPGNVREGIADNASTFEQKLFSHWKQVGTIEKHCEGLRLCFSSDGPESKHIAYITRKDMNNIIKNRLPGDVCTIEETGNEIIVTTIGKAYWSRSNRAVIIQVHGFMHSDMISPWYLFQKMFNGITPNAPLSAMVLEDV